MMNPTGFVARRFLEAAMTELHPLDGFAPSGFFALRTPILPFDELVTWSTGLQAGAVVDDVARLDLAVASDRTRLRAYLGEVYARPEVREALFVASPDLDERFEVWQREPESEGGQ